MRRDAGSPFVSLAVYRVNATGTPATSPPLVATSVNNNSLPTSGTVGTWLDFIFAAPVEYRAGTSYMLGVFGFCYLAQPAEIL
jgi:hypothetical protein